MSNEPIPGIDAALPIALLPVRVETRFMDVPDDPAGPNDEPGRYLYVRIYPDDVHIDDHEPSLTQDELDAGAAYRAGVAAGKAAEAWQVLAAAVGVHRAWWVRRATTPDAAGNPPDVELRQPGTARPTVARALPDRFVVRVRFDGTETTVEGAPIAEAPQVGLSMAEADPSTRIEAGTVILSEGMRWMTELDQALLAGLAVRVRVSDNTTYVDEVLVTGVRATRTAETEAGLLATLVEHHRSVDGAAFVPAGTPTNNLADTASGYTTRADVGALDPGALPVGGTDSNADALAAALGMDLTALATLPAAAQTEEREQAVMQRALFEATWGPYLRQLAVPALDPRRVPQVYGFVTDHLRPGGPLPVIRVGRQPYGVLPIQPSGWQPAASDNTVVAWLGGYLSRIRRLWLSGLADIPTGLALYTHEAVSTGVRVRTCSAMYSQATWLLGLEASGDQAQERRLAAELELGDRPPYALAQLFSKDPARLWLPMAAEGDTSMSLLVPPDPKEATSVLGLLLRNAALQVIAGVADEYEDRFAGVLDESMVGYRATLEAAVTLDLPDSVEGANPAFEVGVRPALADRLSDVGKAFGGAEMTVSDGIAQLIDDQSVVQLDRYLFSDALRAFNGALSEVASIPVERRARLTGEVLDSSSHRYDAWVTALATKRLGELRSQRPTGIQIGAWGYVHGITRREQDRQGAFGFVAAPSLRHATTAGIVRAAWAAHGGVPNQSLAPFATDLRSARERRALALAEGMRNGQRIGALLGYQIERYLHDASGGAVEVDWAIYQLRELFPLRVSTGEAVEKQSERLVCDGWQIAQQEYAAPGATAGTVVAGRPAAGMEAERDVVQAAVDEAVAALDAFADLGLAESLHQFIGRSYERATAATDMVGRAAVPPERFDVSATSRPSAGIEQRLVISFGGVSRPAGWSATTPRAKLSAEADEFVASRLGPVDGVVLRLLDVDGAEVGRCVLGDLGVAALDVAADAAATGRDRLRLMLSRARSVTGATSAVAIASEPGVDDELVDLLEHAASWHRALAGRNPVNDGTFAHRAALQQAPSSPTALVRVQQASADLTGADEMELPFWGIDLPAVQAAALAEARVKDVLAATDPVTAARALFGSDAVVTGEGVAVPAEIAASLADQDALGVAEGGAVDGWLLDTGRVRSAAAALDEALLNGELAGAQPVPLRAAQSPATPYDGTAPAGTERRWVGGRFPAALGEDPVASFVVAGELVQGLVVGLELDAWSEHVPKEKGSAAVAANLRAPDSRPPNAILLAVPAAPGAAWSQNGLFSVIDEAVSLTQCRLVDLEATRRVPRLLPACHIADYAEPHKWTEVITDLRPNLSRYVGGVSDG